MHACIHTHIRICTNYIHAYTHANIHTYILAYTRLEKGLIKENEKATCIDAYMHE